MRARRIVVLSLFLSLSVSCVGAGADPKPAGQDEPKSGQGGKVVRPVDEKKSHVEKPAVMPSATQPGVTQLGATRPGGTPTTRPMTEKLTSGDPKVDAILDRMETKGQAIKGLACGLTYKFVTVFPVEDAITKRGSLLFRRGEPNSRFLIHFKEYLAGGVIDRKRNEYFQFDGEWLTERNDKAQTIIRRQIVRKGRKVDPFKLGKGPFPLPFGQKRDEIIQNFNVSLMPAKAGDPANSIHLHCIPVPKTELARKYSHVEMFVDRTLSLPVRIVTERVSDGNRIEVDFRKIEAGKAPAESRFVIEVPEGFEVREEPLPPGPKTVGSSAD